MAPPPTLYRRRKLYYDIGSIDEPYRIDTDSAVIICDVIITDGPTQQGIADRYLSNLEPNTAAKGALVDCAITAWFVPSVINLPVPPPGLAITEQYGYFYTLDQEGTVAVGDSFYYDTNGPSTAGIQHVVNSTDILIVNPGTYQVVYEVTAAASVAPSPGCQIALFLNNIVVPGTTYGCASDRHQNTGFAIIETTVANTILQVRNHLSAAAVSFDTPAGGSQSNNIASVMIKQLNINGPGSCLLSVTFFDAVTGLPVDDPATVNEVRVVVSVQGFNGGSIAGTLYVQKQHSIEA